MTIIRISATRHDVTFSDGTVKSLALQDKKAKQRVINQVKDVLWPREVV